MLQVVLSGELSVARLVAAVSPLGKKHKRTHMDGTIAEEAVSTTNGGPFAFPLLHTTTVQYSVQTLLGSHPPLKGEMDGLGFRMAGGRGGGLVVGTHVNCSR